MKSHEIKGNDIITLTKVIDKPVLVDDVEKLVTGGTSGLHLFDYNMDDSVERLYTSRFIRKNKPKEFLEYLTANDLKKILKKHAFIVSGLSQKSEYIDEVEKLISDEVIISQEKYKSFYIGTAEGKDALKKYENVVWFHRNKDKIFGWRDGNNRFNEEYFYKNYDKDPIDLLIEYYKDRSQEITGRLYSLREDYDTGILYATNSYTINLNKYLKDLIEASYLRDKEKTDYLFRTHNNEWIDFVYKQVFDKEDLIDSSITESYSNLFEYKNLVTKNLFTNIIQAMLQSEKYDLKKYTLELITIVDEKYPNEPVYDEIAEQRYRESMLDNSALLDLLIEHLDLDLLEQLKDRVDLKIEEWKNI